MTKKKIVIVDLFCGAGGTSTGAISACEELELRHTLTAINHWPVAVDTHTLNHPDAVHFCQSIDTINPRNLFRPGEVFIMFASPECMGHSKALGGTPVNDQSRATAWCVTRWAEAIQPEIIIIENVEEFKDWAPLGRNGRPLKSKKGKVFETYLECLRSLGYKVEWRILCAADFGAATSRRRLFIVCTRGRRKFQWPEPTHNRDGENLFGGKKWRAAREIINFSHPSKSIFGRKKPLADNTLRRIESGLKKFGIQPFLVPQQSRNDAWSLDRPMPTITSRGCEMLCEPFLVTVSHGGDPERRAHDLNEPLKTLTAKNNVALCEPFLVRLAHTGRGDQLKSLDEPLTTVTTKQEHALIQPFLISYYGNGTSLSIEDPLDTVTTKERFGLVEPFLIKLRGTSESHLNGTVDIDEPLPTITAGGQHVAVCEPYLISFYGASGAQSLADPLATLTGMNKFGLVLPKVMWNGQEYWLDIHLRMLQPDELSAATGFPAEYQYAGNKTEITKQIGNAVPPVLANALARAALVA
jgi:DNA (cytosine-5)-methyltransferase 1